MSFCGTFRVDFRGDSLVAMRAQYSLGAVTKNGHFWNNTENTVPRTEFCENNITTITQYNNCVSLN